MGVREAAAIPTPLLCLGYISAASWRGFLRGRHAAVRVELLLEIGRVGLGVVGVFDLGQHLRGEKRPMSRWAEHLRRRWL